MVTFEPTAEQQLIQRTAREFGARELAPRAIERDVQGLFPRE